MGNNKNISEGVMSTAAMFGLQWIYSGNSLFAKAAFNHGMSPLVFITYRQAISALVLVPICIFMKWRNASNMGIISRKNLGFRGFALVFLASLVGACLNQVMYMEGLKLASSSVASAVSNLVPAITFLIAALLGMEIVDIKSSRSLAKIFGTVISVGGAVFMALFKGPKLLNMQYHKLLLLLLPANNNNNSNNNFLGIIMSDDWIKGCFLVLASNCCWSLWLILQVPICKNYLDPLSLSTWMSFLSVFQSAILTFYLEPDPQTWKLHSPLEFFTCLYAGILGTAVTFYVQSWCIARRGPLFSAMFTPLCTVITTILACIILHEQLYLGSLIGAVAVVAGLYAVLWGKAKEFNDKYDPNQVNISPENKISDEQINKDCESSIKMPLLSETV